MAATGLLTKGIELGYRTTATGEYTKLPDLQEIPDLGGSSETVEVTTLDDAAHRYIKGLIDYGDLEFTFLYDNTSADSSYRVIRGLEEAGNVVYWQVKLPDGTKFAFSGEVATKIAGTGTNEALTFTAAITLNSEMAVTNPA